MLCRTQLQAIMAAGSSAPPPRPALSHSSAPLPNVESVEARQKSCGNGCYIHIWASVRASLTLSTRARAPEQWVEQVDAFSLELAQKYGPRYGIWLPASKVWIPWLRDNW